MEGASCPRSTWTLPLWRGAAAESGCQLSLPLGAVLGTASMGPSAHPENINGAGEWASSLLLWKIENYPCESKDAKEGLQLLQAGYSQYFKDLKKGEEWTCCWFCCQGAVLQALYFPAFHNNHKMQFLCVGKCGNSLEHLILLDSSHWTSSDMLLLFFPSSPLPPQARRHPALPGKPGQSWRHAEIFRLPHLGGSYKQELVWRQRSSYRLD